MMCVCRGEISVTVHNDYADQQMQIISAVTGLHIVQ